MSSPAFVNNILSTISYSPTTVSFLFQLALCRLILIDMIGLGFFNTAPLVPETISGTLTVNSTQVGNGNAKVTTEIVGLNLLDSVSGIEVDITSSKAEITANGNTGKLSLIFNTSAGTWNFPSTDASFVEWPTRLDWTAFSGVYSLGETTKSSLWVQQPPLPLGKT